MTAYRFDLVSKRLSTTDLSATAAHTSLVADTLYVVDGTAVKAAGAGSVPGAIWKSRKYSFPWPEGAGWVRVNGPSINSVTVKYYLNGVLVHTHVMTSRDPKRLPAKLGHRLEFQIESSDRVTSISFADAAENL